MQDVGAVKRGIWTGCLCLAVLAGCGGDDDGGSGGNGASGGSGGFGGSGGGSDTTSSTDTGTRAIPPFADTPLSGKFKGQDWTFASGLVNAFFSEGEPGFYTDLFGEALDQCDSGPFEMASIKLDVPKVVGEYELSYQLIPVTFLTEPGVSFVTDVGRISVREVTDTQVTAALYAYFDDDFEVNGVFQVPICD